MLIALMAHMSYRQFMETNKNDLIKGLPLDAKLTAITAYLDDQKALDPFLLKLSMPNAIADAVVIATATSRRHAQGLAKGLLQTLSDAGADFSHMEGFEAAQWILLDCNDVLVHIFQEDTRDLYRLEELCRQANDTAKEINS